MRWDRSLACIASRRLTYLRTVRSLAVARNRFHVSASNVGLKMVPKFVLGEPSFLDDPLEKPPRKLSAMHRHDSSSSRCGISQGDMASFLAFKMEARALQSSNDFLGRHARQPCEHTLGNDRGTNRDAQ